MRGVLIVLESVPTLPIYFYIHVFIYIYIFIYLYIYESAVKSSHSFLSPPCTRPPFLTRGVGQGVVSCARLESEREQAVIGLGRGEEFLVHGYPGFDKAKVTLSILGSCAPHLIIIRWLPRGKAKICLSSDTPPHCIEAESSGASTEDIHTRTIRSERLRRNGIRISLSLSIVSV
jgi:hypothetical protein